jgi:hypothetical protein
MSVLNIFWLLLLGLSLRLGVARLGAGEDLTSKIVARQQQEKLWQEYQKLSPEEREVKFKEWRKTNSGPSRAEWEKRRDELKNTSPEERQAKRKELKARLEMRVSELRVKQANASITAPELRELERREQILQRFGEAELKDSQPVMPTPREPAAPPVK